MRRRIATVVLMIALSGWTPACTSDPGEEDDGSPASGGSTGGADASSGEQVDAGEGPAETSTSVATTEASDADETGTTSGPAETGSSTGEPPADVPDGDYCAEVAAWDPVWSQLELDVLELVNEQRQAGATCGGEAFGPAQPLTMEPTLRCAARKHSKDMVVRNFFDHTNPDGQTYADRITMAGFGGGTMGENIQGGGQAAADAMDWWMNSPPHCANIMNPDYQWLGVGYQPGGVYSTTWTQTFGGP